MRWADRALFLAAVASSAIVLLWPTAPGPALFPYADKLVHALVFGAVGWTGYRVGLPVRALGLGLVAYAIGSEIVQHVLLPDRRGDWTDVVADLVGATVGVLLVRRRSPDDRAR